MLISPPALEAMFNGFNTSFNKGFEGAETQWAQIAMLAPSSTRQNTYGWLQQLPRMREWLGDRVIKQVAASGFVIENRKFEETIVVKREDIADDQYGMYGPMFADLGRAAAELADELIFDLLPSGFNTACYDGQNFFDPEHPAVDALDHPITISNVMAGQGPAWYLLDTSRAVRPFIYQEREKVELVRQDQPDQDRPFMRDEYVYGTRSRCNVGFGLWQLAYASQQPLTADNYKAARAAMMAQRGDGGRLLGVKPKVLVAPLSLEEDARQLLNSATINATTNPWAGSATLLLSPWLAE